jgi:hypothetical protein
VEASRKHGPFHTRWRCARENSSAAVPTAPPLRSEEAAETLDWGAFLNRYFPVPRRQDLEALTAYGAYKQGREWRTTSARLSLVPTEDVSAAVKLEWGAAGSQRLLDAIAAYGVERRRDRMAEIERMPRRGLGARVGRAGLTTSWTLSSTP